MDDVNAIAAFSVAEKQAQIGDAIGIKVLKLANQQQQSVLSLLDSAVQSIEQTQQGSTSSGVDIRA